MHQELDQMMERLQQRVTQQRLRDSSLSSDIQGLVQSGSRLSELRSSLNLKAVQAAGPGAVQAVRRALAAEAQGRVASKHRSSMVADALQQHAAQRPGSTAASLQTEHLRSSLSCLEQLTTTLVAEHTDLVKAAAASNTAPATNKYYQKLQAVLADLHEDDGEEEADDQA
jgi:hypothetical protein